MLYTSTKTTTSIASSRRIILPLKIGMSSQIYRTSSSRFTTHLYRYRLVILAYTRSSRVWITSSITSRAQRRSPHITMRPTSQCVSILASGSSISTTLRPTSIRPILWWYSFTLSTNSAGLASTSTRVKRLRCLLIYRSSITLRKASIALLLLGMLDLLNRWRS
jgi:hypothetical protein